MSDKNEAAPGDGFWVKFWGVRGSIPCADASMARYGGNTPCLEVRCGARTLVFDLGSGAPYLGRDLLRREVADIDVFFTHAHLDHVIGLPFFSPFYRSHFSARLWAGPLRGSTSTEDMVGQLMREPFLPITPEIFSARIDYRDLEPGDTVTPQPGITISTIALNHPGGCLGYRIDYAGKSICYITDTEHVIGEPDRSILGVIQNADIVIYDATFTDEEFMPCAVTAIRHGAKARPCATPPGPAPSSCSTTTASMTTTPWTRSPRSGRGPSQFGRGARRHGAAALTRLLSRQMPFR